MIHLRASANLKMVRSCSCFFDFDSDLSFHVFSKLLEIFQVETAGERIPLSSVKAKSCLKRSLHFRIVSSLMFSVLAFLMN